MVLPLIPIILVGSTLASIASSAVLPQPISPATKREIVNDVQSQITIQQLNKDPVIKGISIEIIKQWIQHNFIFFVLIGLIILAVLLK